MFYHKKRGGKLVLTFRTQDLFDFVFEGFRSTLKCDSERCSVIKCGHDNQSSGGEKNGRDYYFDFSRGMSFELVVSRSS